MRDMTSVAATLTNEWGEQSSNVILKYECAECVVIQHISILLPHKGAIV
jgi:hypothetical protein